MNMPIQLPSEVAKMFPPSIKASVKTLAESAGMDAIDTLVSLRSKHDKDSASTYGIDVYKAEVADMEKLGVIEPAKVKKQAIASASEAAEMLLRIDDMIASKGKAMPPGGPGGMGPGGMGGDY